MRGDFFVPQSVYADGKCLFVISEVSHKQTFDTSGWSGLTLVAWQALWSLMNICVNKGYVHLKTLLTRSWQTWFWKIFLSIRLGRLITVKYRNNLKMYHCLQCQDRNRSYLSHMRRRITLCNEVCSCTVTDIPLVFAAVRGSSLRQMIRCWSSARAPPDHSATLPPAGVSLALQRPG